MENIKTFDVDGNRLIADFEINKYYIVFKNYLYKISSYIYIFF
jgi:hypothetical protein